MGYRSSLSLLSLVAVVWIIVPLARNHNARSEREINARNNLYGSQWTLSLAMLLLRCRSGYWGIYSNCVNWGIFEYSERFLQLFQFLPLTDIVGTLGVSNTFSTELKTFSTELKTFPTELKTFSIGLKRSLNLFRFQFLLTSTNSR